MEHAELSEGKLIRKKSPLHALDLLFDGDSGPLDEVGGRTHQFHVDEDFKHISSQE